jgi:hypothetical protein
MEDTPMSNNTITPTEAIVTLTQESNKALRSLAVLRNEDEMTLLNLIVARAIKDAVYRHRRNAQAWAEKRALGEKMQDLLERARVAGLDTTMFDAPAE